jgi:outer membrane lipoprotein SlyB
MCLTLLAAAAVPGAAQTRYRRHYARHYRTSRTYYTYSAPHRTFWQKHRDKLTLAGGTLGGAMIGGIAGGHKGAAIGALAGAGGSALYTYKLRKRHRRY